MPEPLPLPIRVLVKGPSTIGIASDMKGPRSEFTFPRATEAALLAQGRPAQVRTHSVPSERAKTALRRWESEVLGYSPDVIVVSYGHYEGVHLFLPWWLERHANSWKRRPGPVRSFYRRRLLRPVWLLLARVQARLDTALVARDARFRRPARVVADVEMLISRLRGVHRPLIYILQLQPPSTARYRSWFPGMERRVLMANALFAELVERLDDPDVRILTTDDVVQAVTGGDAEAALPDGFHFSTAVHRAIGVKLADEILHWADGQDHLRVPGSP